MQHRPIGERVRRAFGDPASHRFGEQYLDLILKTWGEVQTSMRRTLTLIIALGTSFFLLVGARGARLTLGPLTINDVTVVAVLVPAVVAHLFYELVVLFFGARRYTLLRLHLVKTLHPKVEAYDLETALTPGTISFWGYEQWGALRVRPSGRMGTFQSFFTGLVLAAVVLGCVSFLIDAYWTLFHRSDGHRAALWISALLAVFSILRAILALVVETRDMLADPRAWG